MKRTRVKTLSLVVFVVMGITAFAGNAWALDWTYSYDAYNDASSSWKYEVYRMGYAFDDDYLYFNMLTGMPEVR